MTAEIAAAIAAIRLPDAEAARRAAQAMDEKTKPLGSLGRLEALAVRLAGIYGALDFATEPRAVVVMAADHGVVRQGVSAYPPEVTAQMVLNFAAGGAAINVLARSARVETVVVDVGVATDRTWPANVRAMRIARGTADLSAEPAMTLAETEAAVGLGIRLARELSDRGMRVLATGEMGIGNTTAAAALTAVFTGRPAAEVTGQGTGVAGEALQRKIAVVERALVRHAPDPAAPLATLSAVGGLEIAALAGLIIGGAAAGLPVVLDGFIAGAAALVATMLAPAAKDHLIAGHRSAERGHRAALDRLALAPLLDLDLRLGEGTGAVLALPLLDAAARILGEMASFASAGVSRER